MADQRIAKSSTMYLFEKLVKKPSENDFGDFSCPDWCAGSYT